MRFFCEISVENSSPVPAGDQTCWRRRRSCSSASFIALKKTFLQVSSFCTFMVCVCVWWAAGAESIQDNSQCVCVHVCVSVCVECTVNLVLVLLVTFWASCSARSFSSPQRHHSLTHTQTHTHTPTRTHTSSAGSNTHREERKNPCGGGGVYLCVCVECFKCVLWVNIIIVCVICLFYLLSLIRLR